MGLAPRAWHRMGLNKFMLHGRKEGRQDRKEEGETDGSWGKGPASTIFSTLQIPNTHSSPLPHLPFCRPHNPATFCSFPGVVWSGPDSTPRAISPGGGSLRSHNPCSPSRGSAILLPKRKQSLQPGDSKPQESHR